MVIPRPVGGREAGRRRRSPSEPPGLRTRGRTKAGRDLVPLLLALSVGVLLLVPLGGSPVTRPGAPSAGSAPARPGSASDRPGLALAAGSTGGYSLARGFAWQRLSPATLPGARAGAGLAPSPTPGEAVLFGGESGAGLVTTNRTLIYNQSLDQWTPDPSTPAPGPRSDFAFGSSAGSAILFGGLTNATIGQVANDTWTFSFSSGLWANVSQTVRPPAREDPAFAVGPGIALLYGGREPNASGSGELLFRDTWTLNLSTDTWSPVPVPPSGSPGPMFGASLVWDATADRFLLFGGCYPCSSNVWAFSPGTSTWSVLTTSGGSPAPRMDAVVSGDGARGLVVVFGGDNGTAVFNDTYVFDPVASSWTRLENVTPPSSRDGAAAAYLSVPDNESVLVAGGSDGPSVLGDTWRFSAVSNLTVSVTNATSHSGIAKATAYANGVALPPTNASGAVTVDGLLPMRTVLNTTTPGFAPANSTVTLVPGEDGVAWLNLTPLAPATVVVSVVNGAGTAIALASVNVSEDGRPVVGSPERTNSTGFAEFRGVPSAVGVISASIAQFHSNRTTVDFPPGLTTRVNITLIALAQLSVDVKGVLPTGPTVPLEAVNITLDGGTIGATDALGQFTGSVPELGPVSVGAYVYGFYPASATVTLNYTGLVHVGLTLNARPFPTVRVTVVGVTSSSVNLLIRNAKVVVASVLPLPTGPFRTTLVTGAGGTASFSAPPGNFSFVVSANGFLENASAPILFAGIGASVRESVDLTPQPLSSLDVQVVSSVAGHPALNDARVTLNYTNVNLSDGLSFAAGLVVPNETGGWANFTGLPASVLYLNGSAPGYETNDTLLLIGYGQRLGPLVLELTPLPPVSVLRLRLLPTDVSTLGVLLALPVVGLVGALVYLTILRNPPDRRRTTRRTGRPPSEPPAADDRPGAATRARPPPGPASARGVGRDLR